MYIDTLFCCCFCCDGHNEPSFISPAIANPNVFISFHFYWKTLFYVKTTEQCFDILCMRAMGVVRISNGFAIKTGKYVQWFEREREREREREKERDNARIVQFFQKGTKKELSERPVKKKAVCKSYHPNMTPIVVVWNPCTYDITFRICPQSTQKNKYSVCFFFLLRCEFELHGQQKYVHKIFSQIIMVNFQNAKVYELNSFFFHTLFF